MKVHARVYIFIYIYIYIYALARARNFVNRAHSRRLIHANQMHRVDVAYTRARAHTRRARGNIKYLCATVCRENRSSRNSRCTRYEEPVLLSRCFSSLSLPSLALPYLLLIYPLTSHTRTVCVCVRRVARKRANKFISPRFILTTGVARRGI